MNLKIFFKESLVLFVLALMLALIFNAVSPKKIKLVLPGKTEKSVEHIGGGQKGERAE